MSRKSLVLLGLTISLVVCLQAQETTAPTATNTNGAATNAVPGQPSTKSGNSKTVPSKERPKGGQFLYRIPIFSGNVVLASGEGPSERVLIKRVCARQTYNEGYTDAKGYFTFQPGVNTQFDLMHASVGSSVGNTVFGAPTIPQPEVPVNGVEIEGCSLVADAPGYRSNPILLSRSRSDRVGLGTIVLTPLDPASGDASVSANSLTAPKKAKLIYEKAVKELSKSSEADVAKSIADLEKAVAAYPQYAEAWTLLGKARGQLGDLQGARTGYEQAIVVDPRYAPAYGPLIALSVDRQDWETATRLAGIALSMDPSDNRSRWFKAIADYQLQHYDDAIALLEELEANQAAVQMYPQSYQIEGLILAKRQQLPEAAKAFKNYLELAPDAEASTSIRKQLSEWQAAGLI